ncbi:MAG TPA: hypothetical protein VGQ62_24615, partial [Chloroflexota bacterium]|nr:hypothetical protein [Chloroflexota bacterium]
MLMKLSALLVLSLVAGCQSAVPPAAAPTAAPPPSAAAPTPALTARVLAVGIPGANAVAPVGKFHPGGPIHDKPDFAAYTQAGRVLDPERILVASSSNFGAPRARDDQPEASALSIDVRGSVTLV